MHPNKPGKHTLLVVCKTSTQSMCIKDIIILAMNYLIHIVLAYNATVPYQVGLISQGSALLSLQHI